MDKKCKVVNISQVPFEEIHNQPKSRQTLVTKEDVITNNIDALTKGTLKPGTMWDWHKHEEYDEIGIVIKGNGKLFFNEEVVEFKPDDVIIIPANTIHKFEASGNQNSEFYLVRIKV